jgi:hypothetical protein
MRELDWDLDTLLLFLTHATRCIPENYQNVVFEDMASQLIEWDDFTIEELQGAFRLFGRSLRSDLTRPSSDSSQRHPSPVEPESHPDHSA